MEEMYRAQLTMLRKNNLLDECELYAAETASESAVTAVVEVIGYRIFASNADALQFLNRKKTLRGHIGSVKTWQRNELMSAVRNGHGKSETCCSTESVSFASKRKRLCGRQWATFLHAGESRQKDNQSWRSRYDWRFRKSTYPY